MQRDPWHSCCRTGESTGWICLYVYGVSVNRSENKPKKKMSTSKYICGFLHKHICMHVPVRGRERVVGKRDRRSSPSSHMSGCQDAHGGICLMYSIYSLHTRCCTTASSVALDTPLAGRVAINQPEWRVSRQAWKLELKSNQHLR